MKTVHASEITDRFAGRFTGELLRQQIEEALSDGGVCQVDFHGVHLLGLSAADETFREIIEDHGPEIIGTRLLVANANPLVRSALRAALA